MTDTRAQREAQLLAARVRRQAAQQKTTQQSVMQKLGLAKPNKVTNAQIAAANRKLDKK
jgi:hypothetical protein